MAVRTIQTPGSRALVWDQLVDLRGAGGLHRALGLVGAQAGGVEWKLAGVEQGVDLGLGRVQPIRSGFMG